MKIRKMLKNSILIISGLILLLFLSFNIVGTRADVVKGITGDTIREVKPGMPLEKVVSKLGRPFKVEAGRGIHNIGCKKPRPSLSLNTNSTMDIRSVVDEFYSVTDHCCEGNREDMQEKKVTFVYSRPVNVSKNYPMLWVHLGEGNKVTHVYAKSYFGIPPLVEEQGIYSLSWGHDTATFEVRQDITTGFINEKAFKECFN